MNLKDAKLYIVELEKISTEWNRGLEPIYVLSQSYDDAVEKAIRYAHLKVNVDVSIIEQDGSLKSPINIDFKVTGVKQACEKIVY